MQTSYPVGPQKTVTRHFLSFLRRSLGGFRKCHSSRVFNSGWLSVQLCRRVIARLQRSHGLANCLFTKKTLADRSRPGRRRRTGTKKKKKEKKKGEKTTLYRKHPPSFLKISLAGSNSKQLHFYPGPKDERETVIVHKGSAHPSYTAHPGWRSVSPGGWCGGRRGEVGRLWVGGGVKGRVCVIKQHSQLRPESCTRRTKRQESGVGMTSADT